MTSENTRAKDKRRDGVGDDGIEVGVSSQNEDADTMAVDMTAPSQPPGAPIADEWATVVQCDGTVCGWCEECFQNRERELAALHGPHEMKASHRAPGARVVDEKGVQWWVVDGLRGMECLDCHGWGCNSCDNQGVSYFGNHVEYQRYLAFEQRALDLVQRVLVHPDLPALPLRKEEWRAQQADAARTVIRKWGKAGIVTSQMLRDIEAEWPEVLSKSDDNRMSPSHANLHPKAAASAGEVGALVNQLTQPPLPAFFVPCEMCDGEGCGWCYGRGLAHPKSTEHDLDQITVVTDNLTALGRTLEDPSFPHRHARALEWHFVMGLAADNLLSRWHQEDTADDTEFLPFDPDRPYRAEYPTSPEDSPF